MKQVIKLIIVDNEDNYLLLYRDAHPTFGNDPDIPGGTLEEGETAEQTMIREVQEEIGVTVDNSKVQEIFSSTDYSAQGVLDTLFLTTVKKRPTIHLSWEHLAYQWLSKEDFLEKARSANDTYMHMVHDVLKRRVS